MPEGTLPSWLSPRSALDGPASRTFRLFTSHRRCDLNPLATALGRPRNVTLSSRNHPHLRCASWTVARTLHLRRLVGPARTVLGRSHSCTPRTVCSSDRRKPHSCVVAARHLHHTRPPEVPVCLEYLRSLLNPYVYCATFRGDATPTDKSL